MKIKPLEWNVYLGSYFADICKIGNETIQAEIIPYTDGTFGLYVASYFCSAPRRLKTAQNKAQKIYDQFLNDIMERFVE